MQSVAVRLICDREREIQAFVPVEYWTITASFSPREKQHLFDAKLAIRDGEKLEIHNQQEADEAAVIMDDELFDALEEEEEMEWEMPE